ncbi:MAG: hypothetical protein AB7L91_10520 [Dehalococcoidia bacterium]
MRQQTPEPGEQASWPFLRSFRFWAILVSVLLIVIFTLQNTNSVEMHILIWSFTASGAFLVLVAVLLGFVAGWVLRSARGHGFDLFG